MKDAVPAHRRHDISDETWALLEPHLPGREGVWGVSPRTIACSSMRFLDVANGRTVVGLTAGLRRLEQRAPSVHSLAG